MPFRVVVLRQGSVTYRSRPFKSKVSAEERAKTIRRIGKSGHYQKIKVSVVPIMFSPKKQRDLKMEARIRAKAQRVSQPESIWDTLRNY